MRIADRVSAWNRARKWELFLNVIKPTPTMRVLDVGFNATEYSPVDNFLEKHYPYPEQITALVQESGALDRTRAAAQDFASRAKACLNGNGRFDFGRALRTVPDFILDRDN